MIIFTITSIMGKERNREKANNCVQTFLLETMTTLFRVRSQKKEEN